ncbi:carbohydrate ABC transporter permease [Schaalia naturae]|jgi:multiple sugar transport system permease protein|uniref:Carbohydrate ABC transporter permease n=1 Tax=Schaalia naturae TaxID=635203 RepID=A0ABW2SIP4_9ACTO
MTHALTKRHDDNASRRSHAVRGSATRSRDRLWGPGFAGPQAVGLLVFVVLPIVMTVVMSLFNWPMIGSRSWNGLENYRTLFGDPVFRAAVRNTCEFVVSYLALNLVVSLGIAAWLSGPRVRHRQFFRVVFFIPTVTPIVANTVVWRLLYQRDGLIDGAFQGLFGTHAPDFLNDPKWAMAAIVMMSVWQGFGYNMLVFSAALDSVPDSVVEAAMLDGAGPVRTFFSVKLPLITPSVFYGATMTLITSFQVFTQPFILTKGGPGSSTTTLVYFIYSQGFMFQRLGIAAAAAWLLFLIILAITILQFWGEKKWVHYE